MARLLSPEARVETGVRPRAVETFLGEVVALGLTRPQAREKLAGDARAHRWNAATQGAILRALRAHYEGSAAR